MKVKLQKILDEKDISIYALSKEIGVAQNNLAKIIKGNTTSIKYDILEKICIALKITPNDIFEIEYPYPSNQIYSKSLMKNYNEDEVYVDPMADMSPDEITEVRKISAEYHMKFDKELEADEKVSNLLTQIIKAYLYILGENDTTKLIFKDYDVYDYFTTDIKVKKYFRILHPFLSQYSRDTSLLALLIEIHSIYMESGVDELSDEELNDLMNDIDHYLTSGLPIKKD